MTLVVTSMVAGRHAGPVSEPGDPEVPERARRRTFSAQYKARILAEYERCDSGAKGALLRREGLYSSMLSEWRKQRLCPNRTKSRQKRGYRYDRIICTGQLLAVCEFSLRLPQLCP